MIHSDIASIQTKFLTMKKLNLLIGLLIGFTILSSSNDDPAFPEPGKYSSI